MKKFWVWVMAIMMLSQPGALWAQEGLPSAAAEADQMADDLMLRSDRLGDDFMIGTEDEDSESLDGELMEEEGLDGEDLLDVQEDTLDQE